MPTHLPVSTTWQRPGNEAFDMLLFRWTLMMLLIAAGVCFAFYLGTGKPQFRQWGLVILKWTVLAALGFFAVLVLERLL
jgi:hypothetical protein